MCCHLLLFLFDLFCLLGCFVRFVLQLCWNTCHTNYLGVDYFVFCVYVLLVWFDSCWVWFICLGCYVISCWFPYLDFSFVMWLFCWLTYLLVVVCFDGRLRCFWIIVLRVDGLCLWCLLFWYLGGFVLVTLEFDCDLVVYLIWCLFVLYVT